jgi:hypothetical protein
MVQMAAEACILTHLPRKLVRCEQHFNRLIYRLGFINDEIIWKVRKIIKKVLYRKVENNNMVKSECFVMSRTHESFLRDIRNFYWSMLKHN